MTQTEETVSKTTDIAAGENNLRITSVELKYPDIQREPQLVAYASFCVQGPGAFRFFVKSVKLFRGGNGYYIQLPHEARKMSCTGCGGKNADHTIFCNWCGKKHERSYARGHFYENVVPANVETRQEMIDALVREHEKRK